jgi:hypothetical protein
MISTTQHKGAPVGKEQKSNKEKRKPKADKKPAASSASPSPFSSVTANQKAGAGKKK